MGRKYMTVPMTEEQIRLYTESSYFRQAVDAFMEGVVPVFLDGAAVRAERMDADIAARIEAANAMTSPLAVPHGEGHAETGRP